MSRFDNLGIGYRLCLAFCLVIGLGLAGYFNAVRAMRLSAERNRRTERVIDAAVGHAKDALLYSKDISASTLGYVYSGDSDYRADKYEADGNVKQAFAGWDSALARLPGSAERRAQIAAMGREARGECEPLEQRLFRLSQGGRKEAAVDLFVSRYIGTRGRLNIGIARAIDAMDADRLVYERGEAQTAGEAIRVGWAVQGVILLLCALIGLGTTRRTAATLAQLEQARLGLCRSEGQLVQAQRIARVGNWRVDAVTQAVTWSDEFFHILGFSPGEVVPSHRAFLKRLHPDDRALVREQVRSAKDKCSPFSLTYRIVRGDGGVRWLHVRGEFIADDSGRAAAMVGTAQDLTERRRAEDALHESEERYRRLVESSPEMIAVHSGGRFVYINAAGVALFGASAPEDLIGRRLLDLIHPDYHEVVTQRVRRIEQDGARTDLLHEKFVRLDGGLVDVEVVGIPTSYDGRPATQFVARDITERRASEESLAQSERRFRALVQNASDIVTVLDAAGTVLYKSPAEQRVLGYGPEQTLGQSIFTLIHPDDRPRVLAAFGATLGRPGEHPPAEFRIRHADGSWRHLESVPTNLLHDPDVRGVVINSRDVTERKASEEEMTYQAFHDALTGLPNRALLMDRLDRALALTQVRAGTVTVLFLDLDNFKVVNDSLGHSAGDDLLMAVAERLATCVPATDTVARIGGDEFAVLREQGDGEMEAVALAERIAQSLALPIRVHGREMFVTASLGVALSAGGETSDGLLRSADVAMYRAKAGGRAGHAVFRDSMMAPALERLELEAALRLAIDREELHLHYQPIVSLETGAVCEVEALARWEHPDRGPIPPTKFIPLAEGTGLIAPLGRWVLREACRQAQRWRLAGRPDLTVSVNLSGRQLQRADLVAEVGHVLDETGLPPSRLKLEITESVMMEDAEATTTKLLALRALGVRLAVDDFGTGYSSMAYLSRFPIDTLKIDRAFVQRLDDAEGHAIVRAIVTLAKSLRLSVTSEGIETEAQRAHLRRLGSHCGQGYLFSPPLPAAEMGALIGTATPRQEQLECAA